MNRHPVWDKKPPECSGTEILQTSLMNHFASLTDPRVDRTKRHLLFDLMVIAICAVICGADTRVDVEEYGKSEYPWLKTFLDLPNGIASHDTFGRVFARLNPEELQNCFLNWIKAVSRLTRGEVIPIDGKTLRRSFDKAAGKGAIHMVSAWAQHNRLILGQCKVDEKSNEITAIPKLLDLLEISGCIVTIDAMGCQTEIAAKIIDKQADYVLALKANQGTLYEDVRLFFRDVRNNKLGDVTPSFLETVEGDHGRIETRRYWVVSDIDWLHQKEQWKGLQSVAMVESERCMADKTTTQTRYYITSLGEEPKPIAHAIRGHRGIENSAHRIPDVAFREDECRIRKDHAPQNFALLRHIALNLLKNEKISKTGVKNKRLKAGWNDDYLLKVLFS